MIKRELSNTPERDLLRETIIDCSEFKSNLFEQVLLFLAKHGNCVLQPVPTYLWRVKQTIRMSHVKLRKRKFLMTWRETMTEIYGSCVDFPLCPQILKILKLNFWFYESKNNCASWYQKLRRHSFLEVSSTQGFITFDQWSFQEIESWCLVHLYWTKQWNTLISTLLCSHEISNNWSSQRILVLFGKNIMPNKENKWCDEI